MEVNLEEIHKKSERKKVMMFSQTLRHLFKFGVVWVVVFLDRIVAGLVIGGDEDPAFGVGEVVATAVKQVAVEKYGVTFKRGHTGKYKTTPRQSLVVDNLLLQWITLFSLSPKLVYVYF